MRPNTMMGAASVLLGAGLAASAVLGPLALNLMRHHVSAAMENQVIGGDVISLALAAPLAIVAGMMWWQGRRLAPVAAIGPALYAGYMSFQFITAPDYQHYDGNSEAYFPLLYAVLLLGLTIGVAAWSQIDAQQLPMPGRAVRLAIAWTLMSVGGLLALAWSSSIYEVATGKTTVEYLEHPTAFWLVRTMDLSIVIPAAIATGIGLLRRQPVALKAAYAVTAGLALLTASVGSMATVMVIRDDPAAEPAFVAVMVPAAIVLGILTALLWRSDPGATSNVPATDSPVPDRPRALRTMTTTTNR